MVVIGLQYFGDYQNNLPTFFTHLLVLVHIYIYVVSWFIVTSCHVRGNALEFAVKKKCKQRITNLLHDDFVDLVVVAVVDVRSVCQGVCDYGREQGQTVYVQQQWRKPAAVHYSFCTNTSSCLNQSTPVHKHNEKSAQRSGIAVCWAQAAHACTSLPFWLLKTCTYVWWRQIQ